jgi:hypothetical protein
MKKLLLLALATCFIFSVASAQVKTLHYGTSDGADLWVTIDSDIEVPVWYTDTEAAPGDPIGFVHMPLASDDLIITSRDGGFFEPLLDSWDDASFLAPNLDQPVVGFTSQSILGFYDLGGDPNDPLYGNPQTMVATYEMHTVNDPAIIDSTRCPFVEGFNPANGNTLLGNIDGTTSYVPDLVFACLYFTPNNDPVWGDPPVIPECIDADVEFCFDLSGTDVDVDDDLHIYFLSGPGTFTETAGGPGGVAAGTWCGTLAAGSYELIFELNDNAGGAVLDTILLVVEEISLDIACPTGVPGTDVYVPVYLNTCEFYTGGVELLIGWDPTVLDFIEVIPAARINYGDEYFNVRLDDGCTPCPPGGSARIVWIANIPDGVYTPPAAPGSEVIMWLHYDVAPDVPFGIVTNIEFVVEHWSDNTISDSTGYVLFWPTLDDGCVNIMNPDMFKGDPNMNCYFYEIADAVLVARRLIEGYGVWAENTSNCHGIPMPDDDAQEAAADLNNNGFVDVADLVRFINIINGNINPPKLDPTSEVASFTMPNVVGDEMTVAISSALDLGGALISIDHTGIELGEPIAHGMEVLSHDADGVLNLVVFSLEGNTIAAGKTDLVTIPVISNNGGTMEFSEVSAADSYGRLLESSASLVAPLPTEFAVKTNYPNPFNAKTMINFDLPINSDVNISIYSITGQLVDNISGHFEAGSHSVTWDASAVASGVYFYKVAAGDFSQTMKMTLLK